jgi:hypothetical protein
MDRAEWFPHDQGSTIGQYGSEAGVIVRDEEHPLGARITLERRTPTAPFAITCGVYGWMVHTRFFSDEPGAKAEYEDMRDALTSILNIVPEASEAENNEKMRPVNEAVASFVERFP